MSSLRIGRQTTSSAANTGEQPPDIDIGGVDLAEGSCVTLAALLGARRIRVSSGAAGRSRGPGVISGVMVEYGDGASPAIAGQWIRETGSLELGPGEAVVQIDVLGESPNGDTRNYGKLAGLVFGTTLGRRVVFHGTPQISTKYAEHRATPLEDLVRLPPIVPTGPNHP